LSFLFFYNSQKELTLFALKSIKSEKKRTVKDVFFSEECDSGSNSRCIFNFELFIPAELFNMTLEILALVCLWIFMRNTILGMGIILRNLVVSWFFVIVQVLL
jgi:transcriptional antiterminator